MCDTSRVLKVSQGVSSVIIIIIIILLLLLLLPLLHMVIVIIISGDTPQTSGQPQVVPGRGVPVDARAPHPPEYVRGLFLALCERSKVSLKYKIKFLFNAGMAKTVTLAQSAIYRLVVVIEEVKRCLAT